MDVRTERLWAVNEGSCDERHKVIWLSANG
jgi:hypothetical protein